jgi:hypothetical protein
MRCRQEISGMLITRLLPFHDEHTGAIPRNPNALYQDGEIVAEVDGAVPSQGNHIMTFRTVRTHGKADKNREVEYQDWVLNCPDLPGPPPNVTVVNTMAWQSVRRALWFARFLDLTLKIHRSPRCGRLVRERPLGVLQAHGCTPDGWSARAPASYASAVTTV